MANLLTDNLARHIVTASGDNLSLRGMPITATFASQGVALVSLVRKVVRQTHYNAAGVAALNLKGKIVRQTRVNAAGTTVLSLKGKIVRLSKFLDTGTAATFFAARTIKRTALHTAALAFTNFSARRVYPSRIVTGGTSFVVWHAGYMASAHFTTAGSAAVSWFGQPIQSTVIIMTDADTTVVFRSKFPVLHHIERVQAFNDLINVIRLEIPIVVQRVIVQQIDPNGLRYDVTVSAVDNRLYLSTIDTSVDPRNPTLTVHIVDDWSMEELRFQSPLYRSLITLILLTGLVSLDLVLRKD